MMFLFFVFFQQLAQLAPAGLLESSFDTVIDKSVLDTFACGALAKENCKVDSV